MTHFVLSGCAESSARYFASSGFVWLGTGGSATAVLDVAVGTLTFVEVTVLMVRYDRAGETGMRNRRMLFLMPLYEARAQWGTAERHRPLTHQAISRTRFAEYEKREGRSIGTQWPRVGSRE